jgi:hypothetical protein
MIMKHVVFKHEDFRRLSDEKVIRCNKSSDIFDDKNSDTSFVSKLRDTKLIRCNKSSDIFDDKTSDTSSVRKLKHNVINLMVQKSRRDDTSVENIKEYCDDNLRITDMSSIRDSMKVGAVFYRCVVPTGLLFHYKIDDIELKHTFNNVSSLRDFCSAFKLTTLYFSLRTDGVSYCKPRKSRKKGLLHLINFVFLNHTVNNVSSRRDFWFAIKLTTLCLSLRTDDVLYDVLRQTASADYPKK